MFKVFTSRLGTKYLYESITNNIFEADAESLALLGETEGRTELLQRIGGEFYETLLAGRGAPPLHRLAKDMLPDESKPPEILVLELTQQCNFRCDYCIYSGSYFLERTHSDEQMDERDINSICQLFFSGKNVPEYVSFYGGEPLLRFDLIKRLCALLKKMGHQPGYSITTNGSLLLAEHEILPFLIGEGFHINVSYDGLNHDIYRHALDGSSSSASVMNALAAIRDMDSDYYKRSVTVSTTLAPPYDMLSNARHFMESELLSPLGVSVNLVNEGDNLFLESFDCDLENRKLSDEVHLLAEEYINCEGEVPKFLVSLFANSAARLDAREMTQQAKGYPPGQCKVGHHRVFVTASGEEYMCERVGAYGRLGSIHGIHHDHEARLRTIEEIDGAFARHCSDCYLVRICDMCASSLRRGIHLKNDAEMSKECEIRRRWYDLIFYVYLSRKELGKDVF